MTDERDPPLSPDPPVPPIEAPDVEVAPSDDDRDPPDGTGVSESAGTVEAPD